MTVSSEILLHAVRTPVIPSAARIPNTSSPHIAHCQVSPNLLHSAFPSVCLRQHAAANKPDNRWAFAFKPQTSVPEEFRFEGRQNSESPESTAPCPGSEKRRRRPRVRRTAARGSRSGPRKRTAAQANRGSLAGVGERDARAVAKASLPRGFPSSRSSGRICTQCVFKEKPPPAAAAANKVGQAAEQPTCSSDAAL